MAKDKAKKDDKPEAEQANDAGKQYPPTPYLPGDGDIRLRRAQGDSRASTPQDWHPPSGEGFPG